MNDADTRPLARSGAPLLSAITTPAEAVGRWLSAVALRFRIVRDARALHGLDDRMLSDIGIGRGEIESAVRNGRPGD